MNKFLILLVTIIVFFSNPFYLYSNGLGDDSLQRLNSLKPIISSFNPSKGFAANGAYKGTEILITGSNFASSPVKNTVWFGTKKADVIDATKNSITVRVPHGAKSGRIRVKTSGGSALSNDKFIVIGKPLIEKFSPLKAAVGDEVLISGSNFLDENISKSGGEKRVSNILDEGLLKVKFGTLDAQIKNATENEITAIVPKGAQDSRIKVTTPAGTAISKDNFIVEVVSNKIQDFYSITADSAIEVTLDPTSSDVDFDLFLLDNNGQTIKSSETRGKGLSESLEFIPPIKVQVFIGVKVFSGSGNYTLTVDRPKSISNFALDKPPTTIKIGDTVKDGILDPTDNTMPDGVFYDRYTFDFEDTPGKLVTIKMDSNDFDAYLILIGADNIPVTDDDSGGGFNAQINTNLQTTGTYTIIARSSPRGFLGTVGSYTLSLIAPSSGKISGTITVQPYITINEKEPNDSLQTAQPINALPVIIFGSASSSDSGSPQTSFDGDLNLGKMDFIPGEFIVKFSPEYSKTGFKTLSRVGNFKIASPARSEMNLIRMEDANKILQGSSKSNSYSKGQNDKKLFEDYLKRLTVQMLGKLKKLPGVEIADLNYIRKAYKTPDDKNYDLQWHYPIINLPQAWDITTGNDKVIVAVVDTGIVSAHPDFKNKDGSSRLDLADGYDFISDPANALDGNGIDSNPEDPGDDPAHLRSSFHGTHVSGTIGAATDNEIGVAGVTWKGKIMPLRALGANGGTDYDIIQACFYAAGLTNDSGTVPTNKANVINMSLGGSGFSQSFQDVVTKVIQEGVTIVAAAGNEDTDDPSYPAAYNGVISVGAIDLSLKKAPYSNFGSAAKGSKITVVAAGGNKSVDINNDGYPDGVLSTLADQSSTTGEITGYTYKFYQGTSMATPHVAGLVALLQAARLDNGESLLLPKDVEEILTTTAMDLGNPGKDDIYGYGLVDAQRAVEKAIDFVRVAKPELSVSTTDLNFGNSKTQLTLSIINSGSGTLNVSSITGDATWLTVVPTSGSVTENNQLSVTATVDRTGLADGAYSAEITINSDGGNATVNVNMQAGKVSQRDIGTIYLLIIDKDTFKTIDQVDIDSGKDLSYESKDAPEGNYLIIAGTDRNNDLFVCGPGEACGAYPTLTDPQLVAITANGITEKIDFEVSDQFSISSSSLANFAKKGFKLQRLR